MARDQVRPRERAVVVGDEATGIVRALIDRVGLVEASSKLLLSEDVCIRVAVRRPIRFANLKMLDYRIDELGLRKDK